MIPCLDLDPAKDVCFQLVYAVSFLIGCMAALWAATRIDNSLPTSVSENYRAASKLYSIRSTQTHFSAW